MIAVMINKHLALTPVLMAAQETAAAPAVPDWVHLLPGGGGQISTADARGPYHVTDPAELIAASFAEADRLPIDENHATDLAAPLGQPSPARGWIVEMQARADGIWGRVEWTEAGRALVADRAYRAISPVVLHDTAKRIMRVLRASLVNRPNLRGLAALNQESDVKPLLERLAETLGLDAAATEDAVVNAVKETKDAAAPAVALQAQLAEIGQVFGVTGDGTVVLEAARKAAQKPTDAPQIVALQAELTTVTTRLNTLTDSVAREKATAFVDGAIQLGRVGVKPLREHYIAMHMADAGRVEKEIGALPVLGRSGAITAAPPTPTGEVALNAEQLSAAKVLGLDPKSYAATLKAERAHEESL
jgi:phage I-like protein